VGVLSVLLFAACGSSTPNATQGPDGGNGGGGGGGPTATPAGGGTTATQTTGGNGNQPAGWDRYGKVSYTVVGSGIQVSGEQGFVPAGSSFGGPTGTSLSFQTDGSNTIFTIVLIENSAQVNYGDPSVTVPASMCTTSNVRIEAGSAAGSFDCGPGMGITAAGATVMDVTVKGSFTARAS
jgi:hypothetical protein